MIRRLILVARLVLGMVFLYAAYTKLRQPWEIFALSIDSYQVLPPWAVFAVARTLPWLELVIGVLLLAGVFTLWVSAASTALLGAFFALMVYEYGKGAGIDCGCFGLGEAMSPLTLLRDGSLLALSGGLAVLAAKTRGRGAAAPAGEAAS
jgi:uncharacterized membrane protein YphA (DoxX/SURF4 family)